MIAGNDKFLHRENIEHNTFDVEVTVVHLAVDNSYIGYIIIADKIKQDAVSAISRLKQLGIENNVMLTGYNKIIAYQIAQITSKFDSKQLLVTGGGTKNTYLIERISELSIAQIHIPDESISDFKEAIIFAYLGALFLMDQPNCVSSVTGAQHSVIGGCLHKVV